MLKRSGDLFLGSECCVVMQIGMRMQIGGCKGGSHFYSLPAYRSTERKNVFKLEQEFDERNPYMKFGRNPIKND